MLCNVVFEDSWTHLRPHKSKVQSEQLCQNWLKQVVVFSRKLNTKLFFMFLHDADLLNVTYGT